MGWKEIKIWVYFVLLVLAGISIAGWFFFGAGQRRREIRNVVLISIDTWRADYLGCYGYPRDITPNIDAVAEEAIVFEHVLTPVPLTLPGHASMLTGTIPPYHGVHDNIGYRLGESNLTIAEILRRNGYTTGAVISTFVMDSQFGLAQGFSSYNDEFVEPIESFYRNERRGGEASQFACSWLEKYQNQPFFLFLHYYDPHDVYNPPEPFATIFKDNLYAGEIAYTDYCIGQVIKKLKELNLYDSTLLIITADHGESLGEHFEHQHGYFIYQASIHVPLIIKVPGGPKGKRVDETVGLIDIVPTICRALGISPPSNVHGTDLSGFLGRKKKIKKDERYIYCESLLPMQYGCSSLLGVVNDRWKYIEAPRQELYDLEKDPDESVNLADKHPKRARLLQEHLKLILQEQLRTDQSDDKFALDAESRRRLESLGYVGGGVVEEFEFDSAKGDPKDSIRLHEQIMLVSTFIKTRQYTKAETVCNQILAERPEYILNSFLRGQIALGRNNISESIAHFSRFLSQVDEAGDSYSKSESLRLCIGEAHHSLGRAFAQQENFSQAIAYYNKALEIEPDAANIYYNLGNAFLRQDKLDEAIKHYTKALELDPDQAEAYYNLGNALLEQERFDEAIIHYNKAIELKPDWREPRNNLQIARTRKEQSGETVPWLK